MSLRVRSSVIFLTLALSQAAHADFYLHHWENRQEAPRRWRGWAEFSYLRTTSNFNRLGETERPIGLELLTKTLFDLGASYGINSRFTLFGQVSWAGVGVDAFANSASSFGFADQTIGINARLIEPTKAGLSVDFQFQTDFAVYDNQAAALKRQPYLGDGNVDFTGGGFVSFPFYSIDGQPGMWLTAGVGFRHRTDGFSQAIPWSIVAKYQPAEPGLYGNLGIFGLQSLNNDTRTQLLAFDPLFEQNAAGANGGSYTTNAVNPSLMTIRMTLGYQASPTLGFSAHAGQAVTGTNAPKGFVIGVGIQFYPEASGDERRYSKLEGGLQSYSLEARVKRIDGKRGLLKIDKGNDASVNQRDSWDIFRVKADGSLADAVARAKTTAVGEDESTLTVMEYFKEVWIEEGFVAKRVIE